MANVTVSSSLTPNKYSGANRAVVRTSGNRVYTLFTSAGGTTPDLQMYKGNIDGEPASFSQADGLVDIVGLQNVGGACAIDSNDIIHCIYYVVDPAMTGVKALRYVTFDTSDDTFGTPESVATLDNDASVHTRLAIAIDANDDPHVIWRDALTDMGSTNFTEWYSNKISGSWSTRVSVETNTSFSTREAHDLIIGEPTSSIGADRPIIIGEDHDTVSVLNAWHGTALNATAFTEASDITGAISNSTSRVSFAIDSNGKITVAFVENTTNDLMIVEHLDSSAWGTWETPVDVDTSTDYLNPSIAVIGTDRYIFVEDSTNSDIDLWKNENNAKVSGDAEFGTAGTSVIEEFDTYTDQTDANASWIPNDNVAGKRVNVTTDLLEFTSVVDNTVDSIAFPITAVSDTVWSTQFKLDIVSHSDGSTTRKKIWIGLSDSGQTLGTDDNQDIIAFELDVKSTGNALQLVSRDGATVVRTTFARAFTDETLYVRLSRLNSTTARAELFSDSAYSVFLEAIEVTFGSTIQTLDNFVVRNRSDASSTGNIVVTVDDIELWDGFSNPPSLWTEETTDPDLPNVGTFNDVKVKWAKYWNKKSYSTDYYFNGSLTDNNSVWTNDTNANDGSTSTSATTTSSGSTNWLQINGTNAPASGDNIDAVHVRLYTKGSLASTTDFEILDGGTSLQTTNITAPASAGWSDWILITPPSGGWTYAKLQGLEVRYWNNSINTIDWYKTELRIVTNEESNDLDYVFEASSGNVLYNTFLVSSGGTAFDRTAVQTITESDAVARIQGHNRIIAQSITELDAILREGSTFARTAVQTITEVDALGRIQSHIRVVAQSITESDAVVTQKGFLRIANQTITESDAVDRSQGLTRSAVQTITESDIVARIQAHIRTAVQSITESDAVSRIQSHLRTVAQTITESDAVTKLQVLARSANQTITESDAIARILASIRTVNQTITESDVVVTQKGFLRTAVQTITESDVVARIQSHIRTAVQTITESDAVARIQSHIRTVAQAITESDVVATQKGFLRTASQTITESDVVAKLQVLARTAVQTITHSSVTIREFSTFIRAVAQTITESDVIATQKGFLRTANQTITESDAVATQKGFLRTAVQTITESDAVVRLQSLVRTVAQSITESDAVARIESHIRTAVQTITESDAVVTAGGLARQVVQSITESDSVVRLGVFARTVAQLITQSDSVLREFSTFVRTVAQSITESDSVVSESTKLRSANQTITESDVVVTTKGFLRTAVQSITESDSVVRLIVNIRAVAQLITESDSVVRLQSIFRTVAQSITESDVVTRIQTNIRSAVQSITESDSVARLQSLLRTVAQLITESDSVVAKHDGAITPIQKRLTQSLAILENTDRTDVALDSTGETLAILENTDTTTIKTKKVV